MVEMIGLVNLDSKLPNIALEKIRLYHKGKKDIVSYIEPIETLYGFDKVYCSSIFTATDKSYVRDSWVCGGSGFDIKSKLPEEIECMKPKINIGFTSRGCIRNCPFCIVPKKEGKLRPVGDIYDFWDRKSKDIILYDNNILGLPEHFRQICKQIKREKLKVDFNQGLDIRLLSNQVCMTLKELRHKEYHFAFDQMKDEKAVRQGIELLKKHGINRSIFYILVGFNTTFEEDLYRAELLKGLNQNAFIQRYNYSKGTYSRKYNELASWCGQRNFFHKFTFKHFCEVRGFI
jgi:hypothetical protein